MKKKFNKKILDVKLYSTSEYLRKENKYKKDLH